MAGLRRGERWNRGGSLGARRIENEFQFQFHVPKVMQLREALYSGYHGQV
jgi:hypothetical protein